MRRCRPGARLPQWRSRWLYGVACLLVLQLAPGVQPAAHAQAPSTPSTAYLLHYTKGVAAFDVKDYQASKQQFELALDAEPDDSKASLYLARALIRLKAYAEAEAMLVALLARDPNMKQARFDLGVAQYNLDKHAKALAQFQEMTEQDPENPLPYFYEGLTLNTLGRYEEAPARFARSWILDKELKPSARFHAGVAYLRMDLSEEATEAFNEVIAADPNSPLAQSARNFLQEMAKPKEKKAVGKPRSWDLSLLVSPQYDDNVILQAPGGQLPEGISRQDDYKTTLYGRGEWRFKEIDTVALGATYSFYQSFHTTLDEFDVQAHSPTLFATYQASGIQARLQYQFDYFSVGREAYMEGHSISPMLMRTWSSNLMTQLLYRFQGKNFNDDLVSFANNSERDGTNHLAGVTQFFLFSERRGNIRAGYVFDTDRARNPTWDYQGHRFSLGMSSPPILTMRFDAVLNYYLQNYLSPNDFSPSLRERRDDIMNATVTVTKPIGPSLSIGLQYLYNRNQSNVRVFDFNRSVFALMGTARF